MKRFWRYTCKVFKIDAHFKTVTDSRSAPRIQTSTILKNIFVLMTARMGSLNAMEQEGRASQLQAIVSADTLGRVAALIETNDLRRILCDMAHQLKRNKCFASSRQRPLIFVAVDGHELFSSRRRCCGDCLERTLEINGCKVTEYYHQAVVCHLIGFPMAIPLDIELTKPKEGELTTAHRLMKRVFTNYPRFFDGVVGDALYMNAPFFNLCEEHGKYAVAVLKDESRELYRDADGLFSRLKPSCFGEKDLLVRAWDEEGFNSSPGMAAALRVLETEETTHRRQQIAGEKISEIQTNHWRWATTIPKSVLSSEQLRRVGHSRWDIENDCFNSLSQHWHLDHCFKHHPVAIVNFILILFCVFTMIQCFHQRNLKLASDRKLSLISVSRSMYQSMPAFLKQGEPRITAPP